MKARFTAMILAILVAIPFALAQQPPATNKVFSDTLTKPKPEAPIPLTAQETKAVEEWEATGKQLAQQWDSALGDLLTVPVECTASMQAHAKLKDIASKRAILTEQLKTMKQTHRLAHNCPTCEYQDTKTMVKGGETK